MIGGIGSGPLSLYISTGMTIELSFKLTGTSSTARMFTAGNGAGSDEVYIQYSSSGSTLTFNSQSAAGASSVTIASGLTTGQWYHVAIVLTTNTTAFNNGLASNCIAYLNGIPTTTPSCSFPRSIYRNQASIGQSGSTFTGYIDYIRIFDIALNTNTISNLYNLTIIGLPAVLPAMNYTKPNITTTGPILSYTFDNPLPAGFDNIAYNTNFTWSSNSGVHNGISIYDGAYTFTTGSVNQQYVDMNSYPDTYNRTMPIVGGAFSAECWFQFTAIPVTTTFTTGWSRLWELAGAAGDASDNIDLTQHGTDTGLYISTFGGTGATQTEQYLSASNAIVLNTWQHAVVTFTPSPNYGLPNGIISLYINGQSFASGPGYTANYVIRQVAYIGKSAWQGNSLYDGLIDSLSFL